MHDASRLRFVNCSNWRDPQRARYPMPHAWSCHATFATCAGDSQGPDLRRAERADARVPGVAPAFPAEEAKRAKARKLAGQESAKRRKVVEVRQDNVGDDLSGPSDPAASEALFEDVQVARPS